MIFLAHTAHWQFLGLMMGVVGWILIMATLGIHEWRLWYVDHVSVITSGVAWVGIWKACFYSHAFPSMENCRSISISDPFAPLEISVAQVLMVVALVSGLAGNISAALAMRMAYFSVVDRRNLRLLFLLSGTLYVATGGLCLVPLGWNMRSVFNNSTIDFPPEFHLPAAPVRQQVGSAVAVGIFASILMLLSGLLFLCYRYAWQSLTSVAPRKTGSPWTSTTLAQRSELPDRYKQGTDNHAFQFQHENVPNNTYDTILC